MRKAIALLLLGLLSGAAVAAPKPCEELKREIEIKVQASGVTSYTLEIVAVKEVKDASMVVGSCAGGSKKIIYQKND
ncbi:hypothetical protein A9179_22030 [Pseudomonas alcaligenes]|uniref:DUF1161 domain-containing protein n=1 Tax=Aquipseudomonas alcaligenes TaxID=43263 RepID=A0ABR7S7A9_AQUAC|nr:DUF1161 domain-containing protein [Pseudomonas alcaligenes]MBC9252949.1 hypothetical protein [Pseudomonas alcaligenes]